MSKTLNLMCGMKQGLNFCRVLLLIFVCSKSYPITGLNRPTGFQEVKALRFLDSQHMKMVGCQLYAPADFTPRIILVLIFRG